MVQITDQKILSEYIMQESHRIAGMAKPPPAVTGVVSWRRSLSLPSLSKHAWRYVPESYFLNKTSESCGRKKIVFSYVSLSISL